MVKFKQICLSQDAGINESLINEALEKIYEDAENFLLINLCSTVKYSDYFFLAYSKDSEYGIDQDRIQCCCVAGSKNSLVSSEIINSHIKDLIARGKSVLDIVSIRDDLFVIFYTNTTDEHIYKVEIMDNSVINGRLLEKKINEEDNRIGGTLHLTSVRYTECQDINKVIIKYVSTI